MLNLWPHPSVPTRPPIPTVLQEGVHVGRIIISKGAQQRPLQPGVAQGSPANHVSVHRMTHASAS